MFAHSVSRLIYELVELLSQIIFSCGQSVLKGHETLLFSGLWRKISFFCVPLFHWIILDQYLYLNRNTWPTQRPVVFLATSSDQVFMYNIYQRIMVNCYKSESFTKRRQSSTDGAENCLIAFHWVAFIPMSRKCFLCGFAF